MGNISFHMENEGAYDGNSRQIVKVFRGKLCKYYRKPFQNMDETGLFAKIPAVRICDPLQVNLTAGNDSDWLIRTLTLATLLHEVEDSKKVPCVRLFFVGDSSSYSASKKSAVYSAGESGRGNCHYGNFGVRDKQCNA